MNKHNAERPLVSLVIPVYNAMPYLLETLDAIPEQGLDPSQLEVILVNDGSDDGSAQVLAEYAERHPNYRLLGQPNSGGPADPCNKGIAAVRGRYFFVLGADDVLTDGALGDLVAYAEEEGSDIVLAKMAGLNGRHAPSSMFQRSIADAHLVEDRLYNSVTAIKLFRTELVARSGAYNPTHLRVGSDQPFTFACYLVADKISVRADRAYILIRKREDGKNVTASPRSSWDYAQLVTATVSVIVDGTEPGALRDGLLRRPVRGAVDKALQPRLLDLDETEQRAVLEELQQSIGPHFTPAVARHLGTMSRLKARLALAGDLDTLRTLLIWQKGGGKERLRHTEDGFVLDLPHELAQGIPPMLLEDVQVTGAVMLENFEVHGARLHLAVSAQVSGSAVPPEHVALRVQHRSTGDWFDVVPEKIAEEGRAGAPAACFRVEVDAARMERGVWDLYAVHRYGSQELVNRLGKRRADRVTSEVRRLFDADGTKELGVAYWTKGHGNLSLDVGHTLIPRPGPEVRALTAVRTEAGARWVIMAAETEDPFTATAHTHSAAEGAGEALTVVPAGDGLVAAMLSREGPVEARWLRVQDAFGASVLGIPEAVAVPRRAPAKVAASAGSALRERAIAGLRRLRDVRERHR
ncbi:glycosyltransferase family 2 protein [Brachybacterium sp.]|uniref:glycosyltransferase family 2 protein n=1 Tax=Brachybacterium sp. TaxID=1891286 RepID=UPI003F92DEB0